MWTRRQCDDILKVMEEKILNQEFYSHKIHHLKGEKLSHSQIKKRETEFLAMRSVLQEMLKGFLPSEIERHRRVTQIHTKK